MKLNLAPNQSRFLYDLAVTTFSAVFVYAFAAIAFRTPANAMMLAAPLLTLCFNAVGGIYSRFRVGSGKLKSGIFGVTVLLTAVTLYFVGEREGIILYSVLAWLALSLPRIFLNLKNRPSSAGFVNRVLKDRGPVLVVGGAGYIGTHVVAQLLKAGYDVRVLDRLLYGRDPIKDFLGNPKFQFIEGDATDITKLVPALDGASAVVHLAGLVGDPACAVDPRYTRHTNVIATRMVKETAMSFGIQRFIFASSCSVYGVSDEEVSETSSLNPVSLYAQTKIDSEKELLGSPVDDFFVTVLRFATVFGHSRRPRFDLVANLFTAQAFIDGKITLMGPQQWRPFVHVSDLARAVVTVLRANPEKVQNQVYNVGDRRMNMTIGDLANGIKKIVDPIRPVEIVNIENVADLRNYAVSFDKIKNDLGFEAAVLLEEGVSEIVNEFKKGTYKHFREAQYSNLEITKLAVEEFKDPAHSARLYIPRSEALSV